MKLRFGLKSLLIFIALLGVTLGWLQIQRTYVQRRNTFLDELSTKWRAIDPPFQVRLFALEIEVAKKGGFDVSTITPIPSVPLVRQMFGDRAYLFVALPEDVDQDFVDRAIDLFPEAQLRRSVGNDLIDIRAKQ